jgi:TonB family protein
MRFDKNDMIAVTGSIIFHLIIILILFFTVIKSDVPDEEEGIMVSFGSIDYAAGMVEPRGAGQIVQKPVPVPEEAAPPVPATPDQPEEMITQDTEETVSLTDSQKEEKERKERERQAEAERKRREEERRRREQAIRNQVAGAFGPDNSDNSRGNTTAETGVQGNPFGNSAAGAAEGLDGIGSFNLSGRSVRGGGLPSPAYTSQIEGRIVIDITVNPKGDVISASIGKGTNIDDASLRNSAIEAAGRAKFNNIQETNNQSGTITYRYSLK